MRSQTCTYVGYTRVIIVRQRKSEKYEHVFQRTLYGNLFVLSQKNLKQLLTLSGLRFSQRWLWRVLSIVWDTRRVVRWKTIDVSKEHVASNFRVEEKRGWSSQQALLVPPKRRLTFNGLQYVIFEKNSSTSTSIACNAYFSYQESSAMGLQF
jgi:hypothetical protein